MAESKGKVESQNVSAAEVVEEQPPLLCAKARGGTDLDGGCISCVIKGWFSQFVKPRGSVLYL